MNGLLAGVAIANPVITGLLTLLVFLEGKKSNKRFEQIESALKDGNRSLIEAVDNSRNEIRDSVDKQKGDFAKIADRLESLSKDTEEPAKDFLEISNALTKSSAVSKEALGKVTTGLENHATSVSRLVTELTKKVSTTSQDSIKNLTTNTTEALSKISQEVSKIESSQNSLNTSLNKTITELTEKTGKTNDAINALKETLNSTVSL